MMICCPNCGNSVPDNYCDHNDCCPNCKFNLWKYLYVWKTDEERSSAVARYREKLNKKKESETSSGTVKSLMANKAKFKPRKVAFKKSSLPENVQKAMRIASQVGIAKEAAKARQVAMEKKEQDKSGELRKQDERLGLENSSNSRNESGGLTIHLRWETVEKLLACLGGLVILITQFVARPANTINVENKNINTDSLLFTLSELHLDFGLNCWLGSHDGFHPTFVVFWEWVGLLAIVWYIGRRIYGHVCAFGWRVHNVVRCRILAVCFLIVSSVFSISVAVGPGEIKIEYPHGELTYVVQSPLYYYHPPLITNKWGELDYDKYLVRADLAELSWFGQAVLNLGIDIGVLGLILLTLRRRNNPMS